MHGARMGRAAGGFTLVEVMVALVVLSVIAALAWRGIDGIVRARDAGREAVDRTVRLGTVLAQWEQDLAALHDAGAVPAFAFDGRAVRLTRTGDGGVRVVVWALRDGRWDRWAGPASTRWGVLQESWLGSQQLLGDEPGHVRLLDGVAEFQVFCFRGNAWSNCQSTGDVAEPPEGAASGVMVQREALPAAVRLVLALPGGRLTRDIALGPQTP
ncbi:MAG: prepilin-type N-terminal cleavage/methylation domain-containing protein [Rubrivivax sp.]|jgi:general secretion pathway protein J|nr:prepilin-type N-terminal cleavage/methylation domain-containing protein [Rubrivivax sp.]